MIGHILRQLSAAALVLLLLIGSWVALPDDAYAVTLNDFGQGRAIFLADTATATEVDPPPVIETAKAVAEKTTETTEAVSEEVTKATKAEAAKAKELAKAEAKKAKKLTKAEAKKAKKLAKAEAKKAKAKLAKASVAKAESD